MSEEQDLPEPDPEALARLREAFAAMPPPAGAAGGEEAAPSSADIWAAVRGELEPEATARIVDRLAFDPALALEWRLAMDLARDQSEAESEVEAGGEHRLEPVVDGAPANDRRYTYLAGALALAAAAGAVLVVSPSQEGTLEGNAPPATRAVEDDAAVLRNEIGDGASLARDAFVLAWSSSLEVSHYELQVTSEQLAPVHGSTFIEEGSLRVPPEQLRELPSGTALLWRVEAVERDGTRHTSPLWRVVLR